MSKTRKRLWVALLVAGLVLVSVSLTAQATAQAKRIVEIFSWFTTGGEATGLAALIAEVERVHPDMKTTRAPSSRWQNKSARRVHAAPASAPHG